MNALRLAAALTVGLLAGSLSLEGLVLVPYWRSLSPEAFADLHAGFAPRLYRFFAPLTAAATSLALASGLAVAWRSDRVSADWFTVASAVLAASLLVFYRLYFHSANERLPVLAADGDDTALSAELRRWQRIHLARTIVSVGAFVLAVLGVAV